MAAQRVAVLLSWLSCCGSALWRYYTKSPDYRIFSTRSTIQLEYEGTFFSEWSVPETCSVKNKSSPTTELRCPSPGIQIIRPIVKGPNVEEERYLFVDKSNTCFLWYYKVINFPEVLIQNLIIWVYDPENADPSELVWEAESPSPNSIMLSKQLTTLGQEPVVYTLLKGKVYFSHEKLENGKPKYEEAGEHAIQVLKSLPSQILQKVYEDTFGFQDLKTFIFTCPLAKRYFLKNVL
ncbi:cation channel sperm-associated protein subunit epsilon-like [Phyllostomus discolor]|uniref:Cation channel sperm-associated protein subunit epsilon-like n=1 Tax=Phyllostomus discolor TaxID=89673 RepID=A0A7E6CYD4_9CHIR|nr:cation channel sperm-associated protein subunit epsilon-like [Phyllostomus discolor]